MKLILLFCLLGLTFNCFSQNDINYKLVDSIGENITRNLKAGNVAYLKDLKPPKNTWSFDHLILYSEALKEYPNDVIIETFLEPSKNELFCAFNLFAYRYIDENNVEYYFAAIISVDVTNDAYQLQNTYLFTVPEALKNWWIHVYGFYQRNGKEQIPEEFILPVCPPPPFKV